MSERRIPKYIQAAGVLTLGLSCTIGGILATTRKGGPAAFISTDQLNNGPIRIRDINSPEVNVQLADVKSLVQYDFSPDGNRIAYVNNFQPMEIHVVNINGQKDRIINPGINGDYPKWSPDGKSIAFQSWNPGPNKIFLVDFDSSDLEPHRLTKDGYISNMETNPIWSPDGKEIAYIKSIFVNNKSNNQIWIVNKDGLNEHLIVDGGDNGSFWHQDWSPDGKEIVFDYYFSSQGTGPNHDRSNIYKINLETNELSILTPDSQIWDEWEPKYSPDSKKILFQGKPINTSQTYTYIMNSDGSDRKIVTDDTFVFSPKWTSDGKGITFATYKNKKYGLYIMDTETKEQQLLKIGDSGFNDPFLWPPQK